MKESIMTVRMGYKIHPEDHRLANFNHRDAFFYIILTRIIDSLSCSPLNKLPEVPEYAEMQCHLISSF